MRLGHDIPIFLLEETHLIICNLGTPRERLSFPLVDHVGVVSNPRYGGFFLPSYIFTEHLIYP